MDKLNIKELLEGFNFVVPEIQREYVWGAVKNKRVLIQFLKDLDQKLSQGDANIGFLYSYKSGAEHYLIDGQQRYTTILLLCYYLAVDEGKDNLAHFIDMLKLNQNIQAFSYRVRSYTESFLQNLFKSGIKNADAVTDQTWYKRDYKDDTTITSMIGALSVFEAELKNCCNIQLERILNHVTFWYFDVDMTSQGEELYITMNSRGEKLTDSEQIKPRLLKVSAKKEFYGKKWDDWEEFFYNKQLRGKRNIDSIDTAMNNMIRIVLELKTLHEHSRINPVEDAGLITIEDIAKYMNAIIELYKINDGNYILEIARLYGDSKEDGDFYVLKALLTERLKDKKDLYEYERVYQTVKNHVRRNKLKNLPFLTFLKEYKESSKEWYDYILTEKESSSNIFNGHELEKINICNSLGYSAEKAIWELQSHPFWNGEIKQMINWSKLGESFSLENFKINSRCFNLLFDQKQDVGWTSDSVRQALITYLPKYPLDDCFFGFTSSQWKEIMYNNSDRFQQFLQLFIDMTKQERNAKLDEIKSSYDEKPENKWAEFVQHDYLLEYCNTKRIQYRNEYGIECVQNCYKQPVSVKNMHLYHYLKSHLNENNTLSNGWICWMDKSGWKSVIKIYNDNYPFRFHIQYRKDHNEQYKIKLIWNGDSLSEEERNLVETVGFIREEERYVFYVSLDMSNSLNVIRQIVIAYDIFLANR